MEGGQVKMNKFSEFQIPGGLWAEVIADGPTRALQVLPVLSPPPSVFSLPLPGPPQYLPPSSLSSPSSSSASPHHIYLSARGVQDLSVWGSGSRLGVQGGRAESGG